MVSIALRRFRSIEEVIIHTGQHFDDNMSSVFFDELHIPKPKFNLDINGGGHGQMTGRMMEKLEAIMIDEKPELVLVYGDTNSTLAGALAAKKLRIPVAHVESGLRSFNISMPEEINRILTDRLSDLLFCPTQHAIDNLRAEGFPHKGSKVLKTGDVMLDAAIYFSNARPKDFRGDRHGEYALCTVHRAENTDDPNRLEGIINALNVINQELEIVMPLHPRTRAILTKRNIKVHFKLIDPLGYLDMLSAISNARLVFTDSGGLQKEAYFFKKPCVTLRDETEWIELVKLGYNVLAGADYHKIVKSYNQFKHKKVPLRTNIYGNGKTSHQIVKHLHTFLTKGARLR